MKRKTLKFAACAAITALMLSLTACGGKDAANTEDPAPVEAVEDEAEPETETPAEDADVETPAEDTEADTAASGTLEELFSDPATKEALDQQFAAMAQDGMSLSSEVNGNDFTIIFKFEDSSVIYDGIEDDLKTGMDAMASTFQASAQQFDAAIGADGACTVIIRYTDPDDNVLAEQSFKAE